MSKTFSFFMKRALLAVLLCVPTFAHADDEAWAEILNGTLTFHYDGNRASAKGSVFDIPNGTDSPKWLRYNFDKVVFDSNFANYRPKSCHAWFFRAVNITSIEGLKYLDTSEVTDMYGMFLNVWRVDSIDVSHFNTENVTDMSFMFNDCTHLTKFDPSHFNTSKVTNMRNMFKGCRALKSIDASNFDTKNVTNMCEMFNYCLALETVDLSGFDTRNVTDMSYMFKDCGNLTSVNAKFSTGNVTTMCEMFNGCKALKAIDLSTFDTKNVTNMDKIFYNCSSVTELDLSGFNTEHITSMRNLFYGCSSLKKLDLSTFNTENVTDMNGMFSGCGSATSINTSSFDTRNVTNMGGMFNGCYAMTAFDLSNFNTEKVTDMSGMFLNCSSIQSLDLTNFKTPNLTRMDYMFSNCKSLSVDLSSFDTRNVTNVDKMFQMNGELKITVTTSDAFKLSKNCSANYMFVSLTGSGYIWGKDKAVYESEGGFFKKAPEETWAEYDDDSKTLTFHHNNKRKATIATGTYLFPNGSEPGWKAYASQIEKVVIDSQLTIDTISSCAGLFAGMSNLKSIEGLRYLNTSAVTDMSSMFDGCSSLTSVDLIGLDMTNVTNTTKMFNGCSALESIYIDDNFKLSSSCDGTSMFADCSSLPGYDNNNVGKEEAVCISSGGYLVNRNIDKAWVSYDSNTKTLTFHYDTSKDSSNATATYFIKDQSEPQWLAYKDDVTTVAFDENFAQYHPTTCHDWFSGMTNLSKIDGIEYLNTSDVTDMSGMFKDCASLTAVDMTGFSVSKVTTTADMFSGCSSLRSIYATDTFALSSGCDGTNMFSACRKLPSFDTASVGIDKAKYKENGGYLLQIGGSAEAWVEYDTDSKTLTFHYDNRKNACLSTVVCGLPTTTTERSGWFTYLEEIEKVVFNSDFAEVRPTICKYWFCNTTKLKTIEGLKYLNTSEVTTMNGMFANATSLTSLDVSTFNTAKVTDMYAMFGGCTGLTSLNVSGLNTSAVTSMGAMFGVCTGLTYIDLRSFDTSAVTDMSDMFHEDTSLTTIIVSDDFTVANASGTNMFKNCTKLVNITDDSYGLDKAKYTSEGGCFSKAAGEDMAWVEFNSGNKTLTFHYDDLKDVITTTKKFDLPTVGSGNPDWASNTYTNTIEKVVFDKAFSAVTPTTCASWFYNMGTLVDIEGLEYLNTSEVTSMSSMFNGCRSLTSLDLSGFNTEKVSDMSGMFMGCQKLESINLSSFNTSAVTTMRGMFMSCSVLPTVNLTSFNTSNVTDMSNMFEYCNKLGTLDLTSFDATKVTSADFMFLNCQTVDSIYVTDKFALSETCTGDNMFNGCTKLAHFDNTNVGKDKAVSFRYGGYLTEVVNRPWTIYDADAKTLTFVCNDKSDYADFSTTYLVTTDGTPGWLANKENITKVIFDKSFTDAKVTSCKNWFSGMTALTDISGWEYLNTKNVTDMAGMFQNCSSLTSLDLTYMNTATATDMSDMFSGCSLLATITVSDDFSLSESCIGTGMFSGCEKLTKYDSSNVGKEMAKYISDGGYLTDLGMEGWVEYQANTNTLTFHYDKLKHTAQATGKYTLNVYQRNPEWLGMTNIENVIINPAFADARPTGCYRWFHEMSKLKSIEGIQYINTSEAVYMDEMFYGCSGLKTLDLSEFSTSKVKSMNNMFNGCSSIDTIFVSDNFVVRYDGTDMFKGCVLLTNYDANNVGKEMAKYISAGGYFMRYNLQSWIEYFADTNTLTFHHNKDYDLCTNKKYLLPTSKDDTYWGTRSEGIRDNVKKVTLDASFIDAKPTICYKWFSDMANLAEIEGLEYLNTSEVTNMQSMFKGCNTIQSLDLSKFNTEKVTDMYGMFQDCDKLTSLDLSSFNTAKVTDMGCMFEGCEKLATLDISGFTTPEVTNMNSMFHNCRVLQSVDLSGFNTEKVTNMAYMFYTCSKMQNIDVSKFNTSNVTTMANMFENCSMLTKLDASNFNTGKVTDMSMMFRNCKQLETVDVSNFNTENVTTMGNMFQFCYNVKSLDLSSFNTNNTINMAWMFMSSDLSKLEKIYVSENYVVPDGCNTTDMFNYCKSLPDYATKGSGGENANYTTGYFTLRRHFKVGDTQYNADGVNAVCYDDVKFGDADAFSSPCDFKMSADNEASYERDVTSNWATVCLPFTFSVSDNTSAKFYTIESVGSNVITVKEVTDTVTAGKPVLAYTDNGTISVTGYNEARVVAKPLADGNLTGTFTEATVEKSANNYIISKNKFWNVASLLESSGANSVKMAPYRAYIKTSVSDTKAVSLDIIADETDGINNIDADIIANLLDGADLYDMQGRRLTSPIKGMMIVKKGNFTRKMIFQ